MNLDAAHDLMDLLLDKAEQPYFTDNEKNQFLDHAIMSFINFHYSFYDQEQVSRDALSYFFHNSVLSESQQTKNLPEGYVHLIQFEIGRSQDNMKSAKILGSKDYLDLRLSSDPFNKPTEDNPTCFVKTQFDSSISAYHNKIHFQPASWPGTVNGPFSQYFCIVFRPHNVVFRDTTVIDPGTSLVDAPLAEIYQREIIDIAVRKMTGNIESPNIQYQQIEAEQSKSI
tara:strand:- start:1166 stop:1846 length:681 start_codon:yes stop_codon:yes gene_type:complete